MKIEKRVVQVVLLLFFGWLAVYAAGMRLSVYDENGLPKKSDSVFRVAGEDAAADYAAFKLMETEPDKAFDPERQTAYLAETVGTKGTFFSFASPAASFLAVPFLPMPYPQFYATVTLWGIFCFSIAMYSIFPLIGAVLMTAALPAVFFNAVYGGTGLFVSAAVVIVLVYGGEKPKTAGVFGGLSVFSPIVFALTAAVLLFRRQKKTLAFFAGTGCCLLLAAAARYGLSVFPAALRTAFHAIENQPCRFPSVAGSYLCAGGGSFFAVLFQFFSAAVVLYGVNVLFHRRICPPEIQNAYFCAGVLLVAPFAEYGDLALFAAAAAFLLRDCEKRRYAKRDVFFFVLTGAGILLNPFVQALTGASIFFFLNGAVLLICMRRSV